MARPTEWKINSFCPVLFFFLSLSVAVQVAEHDGSEPVGAAGVRRSASSRQWKGELCF